MGIISEFEKRTGLVVQQSSSKKRCRFCKICCDTLYAPFDGDLGDKKEYCSDCQMEAESEILG